MKTKQNQELRGTFDHRKSTTHKSKTVNYFAKID